MEIIEPGLILTRKILTEKFPPFKIKVIYFKCRINHYKELKNKAVRNQQYELAGKLRDSEKEGISKFEKAVKDYYSET